LGYELKEDTKPLTVGEFKQLTNQHFLKLSPLNQSISSSDTTTQQATGNNPNIFQEIDDQQQQNPKYLSVLKSSDWFIPSFYFLEHCLW